MNIELKFRKKDDTVWGYKRKMTVKKAVEIYEKDLKNDCNIIEVWLYYFGMWHGRRYKTLKKRENYDT